MIEQLRRVDLLDPSAYTVEGEGGSVPPEVAERVVTMCEENRFAVVLDAFSEEDFGTLKAGFNDTWNAADAAGRVVTTSLRGQGQQYVRHDAFLPGRDREKVSAMMSVISGAISRVNDAAQDSKKLHAWPHNPSVKELTTNRIAPGFLSNLHEDPMSALVMGLEGTAEITMGRRDLPWPVPVTHVARFNFPPNSALYMPVRWHTPHKQRPAHHQIRNTTPLDSPTEGVRTSAVAFY